MTTVSNYKTASKTQLERWKALPYPEYAYVDVSDFGRVRNRVTNTVLKPFVTTPGSKTRYVSLEPTKGIPGKKRSLAVCRLVFEAWNGILLPRGVLPEHINNDATDNRLVNLKLPAGMTFGGVPEVKHIPTEEGFSLQTTAKTVTDGNREQEYAKRYAERMEHLRVAISCCADWQAIEDVERIGILESEWLYALEDLPLEHLVALVLKLITLARRD